MSMIEETRQIPTSTWILYTGGFSFFEGSGAGHVVTPHEGGKSLTYTLVLIFKSMNNEVRYEALISQRLPNHFKQLSRFTPLIKTNIYYTIKDIHSHLLFLIYFSQRLELT